MSNQVISINLTEESFVIAEEAAKQLDQPISEFLSTEVNKMLQQKRVQFAKQRLNLHKKTVAMLVSKQMPGYKSLEEAYTSLGLSESVATFGGIRKVYEQIYIASGVHVNQQHIRINNVVAVAKQA